MICELVIFFKFYYILFDFKLKLIYIFINLASNRITEYLFISLPNSFLFLYLFVREFFNIYLHLFIF